jgi:uncharacterized protein YkwD
MYWKIVLLLGVFTASANAFPVGLELMPFEARFLSAARDEYETFELVNRERSRRGLDEMVWDDELAELARDYSRRMSRERFFDHFDPDGRTVLDRAVAAHIRGWDRIGENLFTGNGLDHYPMFAVRGWMNSKTHRDNILYRKWKASGVGMAFGRDGRVFMTQVFVE